MMNKTRMEAFSDGVLAIIITIMVLEFKVPHEASLEGLKPLIPIFFSYLLSFIYLGIYWNNHHHMMHTVKKINGRILWANLHLLFWLSLVPFATSWLGENHLAPIPLALYGFILLMCGAAYWLLQNIIIKQTGNDLLVKAIGKDLKGKSSLVIYLIGICLTFYLVWLSIILYVFVALMWLIPDQRIEIIIPKEDD